jgi:hypothetical protein
MRFRERGRSPIGCERHSLLRRRRTLSIQLSGRGVSAHDQRPLKYQLPKRHSDARFLPPYDSTGIDFLLGQKRDQREPIRDVGMRPDIKRSSSL